MIVSVYVKDFLPFDAHNTCHGQSRPMVIGPHPERRLTQTAHTLSSLQHTLLSSDQDGGLLRGIDLCPKQRRHTQKQFHPW